MVWKNVSSMLAAIEKIKLNKKNIQYSFRLALPSNVTYFLITEIYHSIFKTLLKCFTLQFLSNYLF